MAALYCFQMVWNIKKGRPGSNGCNYYRPSVSPSLERNFFRCPPPLFRHWHLFIVLFSDAVSIKLRKWPATINDRCHLPYQNSSCVIVPSKCIWEMLWQICFQKRSGLIASTDYKNIKRSLHLNMQWVSLQYVLQSNSYQNQCSWEIQ